MNRESGITLGWIKLNEELADFHSSWSFDFSMTDEFLTKKVRTALKHTPRVVEKKMFGGITFMVNGKMCINAGKSRLMFRFDPAIHEKAVKRKGCQTVIMKGREYKGYVYVGEEGIKSKEDFDFWIQLALDYNKVLKASQRASKK